MLKLKVFFLSYTANFFLAPISHCQHKIMSTHLVNTLQEYVLKLKKNSYKLYAHYIVCDIDNKELCVFESESRKFSQLGKITAKEKPILYVANVLFKLVILSCFSVIKLYMIMFNYRFGKLLIDIDLSMQPHHCIRSLLV